MDYDDWIKLNTGRYVRSIHFFAEGLILEILGKGEDNDTFDAKVIRGKIGGHILDKERYNKMWLIDGSWVFVERYKPSLQSKREDT